MLQKLMAMPKAKLSALVQSIDEKAVKGRAMRRQLATMKRKEGGFTLLELLVVVAILAAIAGTATIMLQDTDRKGAAAAHVGMMDELSKGIQTFRVLNQGSYPNNFDSLLSSTDGTSGGTITELSILEGNLAGFLAPYTLSATQLAALNNVGITTSRIINGGLTPAWGAAGDCAPAALAASIENKDNNVTAQNIFRSDAANGCGAATSITLDATNNTVVRWDAAQNERVNALSTDTVVAFGVGPDSSLFDPALIGALSNVPVYRHVTNVQYNRFITLFKVEGSGVRGQAIFQAIIDGAGDTKDEELGEVDNVRAT